MVATILWVRADVQELAFEEGSSCHFCIIFCIGFQATVNIWVICENQKIVIEHVKASELEINKYMWNATFTPYHAVETMADKTSLQSSGTKCYRLVSEKCLFKTVDLKNSPFQPNSPLSARILLNALIYPAMLEGSSISYNRQRITDWFLRSLPVRFQNSGRFVWITGKGCSRRIHCNKQASRWLEWQMLKMKLLKASLPYAVARGVADDGSAQTWTTSNVLAITW